VKPLEEMFLANDDKKAAAERYIMIVGGAAAMMSDGMKARCPQVHGWALEVVWKWV